MKTTNSIMSRAPALPREVTAALESTGTIPDEVLDEVHRLEHRVALGENRVIALTETFTLRSWLRRPRRAMLMIPAQGSKRSTFNIPIAGYDGGAIMAKQGFFAFAADPEGTGDSTYPADGFSVTYESEAESMARVAEYIRALRLVPRVDVLGEDSAGWVAILLATDAVQVRSCVATSMIYKTGTEAFNAAWNTPPLKQILLEGPNGYFTTFPEMYFNVLAGASPGLRDWHLSTQIGRYAAGPYKQDFERLFGDGNADYLKLALVPGQIIRGELDPNNPIEDVQHLASDYGSVTDAGPAEIAVIPGGGRIMRLDAPPIGPSFWDIVKEFVERPAREPET